MRGDKATVTGGGLSSSATSGVGVVLAIESVESFESGQERSKRILRTRESGDRISPAISDFCKKRGDVEWQVKINGF